MRHVLIIEPHQELAVALENVIACARYGTIVRQHVDLLADVGVVPLGIVMRIGHADVSKLPVDRPPIVAIASSDEDVEEARRMHCEVVLRAPADIKHLCEALRSLAFA
jgi:hypothetical protein